MILGTNLNRLVNKLNCWGGGVGSSPGLGGPGLGDGNGGPAGGTGPGQSGSVVGGGVFGGMSGELGLMGNDANEFAKQMAQNKAHQVAMSQPITAQDQITMLAFDNDLAKAKDLAKTMSFNELLDYNLKVNKTPKMLSRALSPFPFIGSTGQIGAALDSVFGVPSGFSTPDGDVSGGPDTEQGLMQPYSKVAYNTPENAEQTTKALNIPNQEFNIQDILKADYPFKQALAYILNKGNV